MNSTGERLARLEALLLRIDAALVVRDLGSARSAEVFDGLRKQIIQQGKSHRSHVSHLLSLQDSLRKGASLELVADRVSDFLSELGIERISDVNLIDLFEIDATGEVGLTCVEPAVVERQGDGSVTLVRMGRARGSIPVEQASVPGPSDVAVPEETKTEPAAVFLSSRLARIAALAAGILLLAATFVAGRKSAPDPRPSVAPKTRSAAITTEQNPLAATLSTMTTAPPTLERSSTSTAATAASDSTMSNGAVK